MSRNHDRLSQKKALLVGINQYPAPFPALKGCVNDALMMAQVLIRNFGFKPGMDMRLLTDGRATRAEILSRLEWLVEGSKPGDLLVFHYSGHGAQVPDRDGDEIDETDECLCPVDFSWDHPLLDDDLGKIIERIPEGTNFTVILDCCHSGTGTRVLEAVRPSTPKRLLAPPDIQFRGVEDILVDPGRENKSVTMTKFKELRVTRIGKSAAAKGILIAGCRSDQLSNDAWIDGDYHGALTYSLFQALGSQGTGLSYTQWVATGTNLLKAKHNIRDQDPQLEATAEAREWQIFSTRKAPRPAVVRPREPAKRHVVYVHGIGEHLAGYSDSWWQAMQPYVPSISEDNRTEVLWSNLVNPRGRAVKRASPAHAELAQMIRDILADRAQQQFLKETLATAKGEASREAVAVRGILDFGGLDDFVKYLANADIRDQVVGRFQEKVEPLLNEGAEVEVISHSWGTVVAYEALRRWDNKSFAGRVHNLFTVGSALSIAPVRRGLERPAGPKPHCVKTWINLDARGDIVGGPLREEFAVDEEFLNLNPFGCNSWFPSPGCAHSSYFVPGNDAVNKDIFGSKIEQ